MGKVSKPLSLEDLKKEFYRIEPIFSYAKMSFSIVDYVRINETPSHNIVKVRNELYGYLYVSNFGIAVLELYKLTSENHVNDKYNLNRLFNRIEVSDLLDTEIKGAAKKWRENFNSDIHTKAKDGIAILRHCRYAHTAEGVDKVIAKIDMQLDDIASLIKTIESIFSNLRELIFGSSFTLLGYRNPVVTLKVMTDQLVAASFKGQNIIALKKNNEHSISIEPNKKYFLPNFVHISQCDGVFDNMILEAKITFSNGHADRSFIPVEVLPENGKYLRSFHIAGEFFELQDAQSLSVWAREVNRVQYWEGFLEYSFL